jgi:threonine dehydrogenase-like Zn-dependent dehydrogenase
VKANCWYGAHEVSVDDVPDPKILNPRDAILRITTTAICGSDLHLYDGYMPTMMRGDILGHEFMGEVVEVGSEVKSLAVGDRVVNPFPIACGSCYFCQESLYSLCENSNPNAWMAEKLWGHSTAGLFGYSHLVGGYAGGQAQYVRVPFADVGPIKVPGELTDEQVLFLSDVFPTGYMAAENCDIRAGDTVAVWGCGPVGQLAIKSAFLFGAERVIAIDRYPGRLRMAQTASGAEALNYEEVDVLEALNDMTGGRGPDACIDAVGMEAHLPGLFGAYDRVKQALRLQTDRPSALRQAMMAVRNGGVLSIPGVYGGFIDKVPLGSVMNRSVTIRTGQTHVQRYLKPLLERIVSGDVDPSFIITHRLRLDEAAEGYRMFREQQDECIKVVLKPWETPRRAETAASPPPPGTPLHCGRRGGRSERRGQRLRERGGLGQERRVARVELDRALRPRREDIPLHLGRHRAVPGAYDVRRGNLPPGGPGDGRRERIAALRPQASDRPLARRRVAVSVEHLAGEREIGQRHAPIEHPYPGRVPVAADSDERLPRLRHESAKIDQPLDAPVGRAHSGGGARGRAGKRGCIRANRGARTRRRERDDHAAVGMPAQHDRTRDRVDDLADGVRVVAKSGWAIGTVNTRQIDGSRFDAPLCEVRQQPLPAPAPVPRAVNENQRRTRRAHARTPLGTGGWMKRQGSLSEPRGTLISISHGRPSASARSSAGFSACGDSTRAPAAPNDSASRRKSGLWSSEPRIRPSKLSC